AAGIVLRECDLVGAGADLKCQGKRRKKRDKSRATTCVRFHAVLLWLWRREVLIAERRLRRAADGDVSPVGGLMAGVASGRELVERGGERVEIALRDCAFQVGYGSGYEGLNHVTD